MPRCATAPGAWCVGTAQADGVKQTQFPVNRAAANARLGETKPIGPLDGVGREPVLSLPKERPTDEEPRGIRAKQSHFPSVRSIGSVTRRPHAGSGGFRFPLAIVSRSGYDGDEMVNREALCSSGE